VTRITRILGFQIACVCLAELVPPFGCTRDSEGVGHLVPELVRGGRCGPTNRDDGQCGCDEEGRSTRGGQSGRGHGSP